MFYKKVEFSLLYDNKSKNQPIALKLGRDFCFGKGTRAMLLS